MSSQPSLCHDMVIWQAVSVETAVCVYHVGNNVLRVMGTSLKLKATIKGQTHTNSTVYRSNESGVIPVISGRG